MRRPKFTDEGRVSNHGTSSEDTADKSIAIGVIKAAV
jgi:hypothetical protein